jgi:DNA-binding transcriptional ArsR family regulator
MRPSFLDPGTVLFGKTRRRVLGLLFGNPDESFYVRDIVRRSGAAQGAIARELDALLGAGLLWRREDGRNVYYQANKQAPVFPELERLVAKTIALSDAVREALAPLAAHIAFAVIFGAGARGPVKSSRAIDLLVIGDVRPAEVGDALATMKQAVQPKVYPLTEFRKKVADNPRFFAGFFSEPPLFVAGEPDAFRRLGAPRWSKRTG